MLIFRTAASSFFVGLVILSSPAYGHDDQPDNTAQIVVPRLLQSITVTATREPEEIKDVSAAITVVNRDAIERRQAQTPNEMLIEEPGVWSPRTAVQGSPTLRGQIGNRVVYLWDGIRINNGALPSGPNGFFNQMPANAIDYLEVVRGPAAVQYGSDAIGGVINLITRGSQPDPTLSKTVFGGDFLSRYGSVDSERTSQGNFWLTNRRFSAYGGGSGQLVDDYHTPDGIMQNTGFKDAGGSLGVAYSPNARQVVKMSWIHDRRFDVETYSQSKLNPSGIPRIFGPYEQRGIAKVTYNIKDLGGWSTDFSSYVYHQYYKSRRDQTVETSTLYNKTRTDTLQHVEGGGIQNAQTIRKVRIVYGGDYRSEHLNSDRTLFATSKATKSIAASIPSGNVPVGDYKVGDAFVLGQARLVNRLMASFGTRFESTHLRSFPRPQDPVAPFTTESLRLNKRWNSVTWNIGMTYRVVGGLEIAANIATAYRAPTFSDTLSTGVPVFASGVASIPSPNVRPERSITYEAGPRYVSKNLHLAITVYKQNLKDNLFSAPAGTIDIPGVGVVQALSKQNIAGAYVRGLESAVAYRFSASWMFSANATVTRGQDTYQNVPLRFIPPAFGTVGLQWQRPGSRLSVESTMQLVDRLRRHSPDDERDAGFSADPGFGSPSATNPPLRPNYQLPGYAVANLRVGFVAWKQDRRELQLFTNVHNLFNVRYREPYSQQELWAAGADTIIGARVRF